MQKFRVITFCLQGTFILLSCAVLKLFEVALLGLKSLFGQASSLLLKQCPSIYNLRLYDETDISAAHDLSIINTLCKVEAYQGKNNLSEAVKGSDIVLIGDDFLSTPQTSFDIMAPKMQDYAKAIAESSPNAVIIVAAAPINKLVPVLSELLLENGNYDCNKVIGSTAVNNVRANCMLASYVHSDPRKVFLPVIGGDSEETIVPLFSQAKPYLNIPEAVMRRLIDDIKQAHTVIFELKRSSEALNKAYSTVKFMNSVMSGLKGEPNVMNIAFARTSQVDGIEYFALPVLFGRFGIQARYGIPKILPFENDLVNESVYNLKKEIDYAKLFCKSRDTAVELCSRNVANKFQKSKDFERFVNDLKVGKKGEDNMINKLKPPIPFENGRLPSNHGDTPFDTKAFCLKHQTNIDNDEKFIPSYMKSGASISPSLLYTFKKENGDGPGIPKAFSSQTQICQPMVCPDQPKEKPINYSNIVSLVEKLVKQTTEKIINEKEKAIKVDDNAEKCSCNHKKNEKKNSEDSTTVKGEPSKGINMINHKCGDTKLNSNNNDCNMQNAMLDKNINNVNNSGLTTRKRKHSEIKWGGKLNPTLNTFKQREEYKYEDIKLGSSKKGSQLSEHQPSVDLNTNEEKHLRQTKVMKPFCHSNIRWNSSKTMKDTKYTTKEKSFEYKAIHTPDFSKFRATEDTESKSKSIKEILKLISDDQPKKNINQIENSNSFSEFYHHEKQVESKKPIGHTIKASEETILLNDDKNWPKKEFMSRNLRVVGGKLSENFNTDNKIKNNSENLDGVMDEKYHITITKDEKKNYFNQRYKYKRIFSKKNNKQHNECIGKSINDINKNKEIKQANNILIEEDTKLPQKEILLTNHGIMKNQKKTDCSERTKSEKSFINFKKDENKDYFNQKFRSKQYICKLTDNYINDPYKEKNVAPIYQIKESREIGNQTESKVDILVKSACYNTPKNELQKINELGRKEPTTSETVPAAVSNDVSIGKKNLTDNTENEPILLNLEEKKLLSEPVSINKNHDHLKKSQENFNSTQTEIIGKDLNILLQMLDNDVFKCNSVLNAKEAWEDREVKGHENKNNEKKCSVVAEKKDTEIKISPSETLKTKKESIITHPERNEQISEAGKHFQPTLQKQCMEPGEIKVDSIYLDVNPISQLSEKHHASLKTSMLHQHQQSIPAVKKSYSIENQTQPISVKPEFNIDQVSYSKGPISLSSENHYAISSKSIHNKLFPEVKESEENDINLKKQLKTDNFRNKRKCISQSCRKHIRTCNKGDNSKSHLAVKASHSVENTRNSCNVKPKSSFTISEKFIYPNIDSCRYSGEFINPEYSEQICNNCKQPIKNNHKSKKLDNMKSNNENKTIDSNFKFQNRETSAISDKGKLEKQKYAYSNSKVSRSCSSKSFIPSKYKASSKKDKITEMIDIGKTLNKINNSEHSFRIKDKNGMKNFVLLRGSLPKVENANTDKQKSLNSKENTSLLKTKVCNEDPFMAIKNKNSSKNNTEDTKSLQGKSKNKGLYTMHEDINESDSLLITHNSVYSPKCPVHGYKYCINNNQFKKKLVNFNDSNTLSNKNSDVHNSLCRISSKISDSTRSSSPHRLTQKAAYHKPYSTSAMSRHRSPSRMFMDSKKNLPKYISTKDVLPITITAKKTNGFHHKQKITKILENGVKKCTVVPKKNATTQTKVSNTCGLRETYKLKEVNKTQPRFMTGPIVPFPSEVSSRTVKIVEQFFNRGFDSSLAKRSLKSPPKYSSCPWMSFRNVTKESGKVSRMETRSFNINWSISHNRNQKCDINPNEYDILERGTCLEHVKNKFLSNNANMFNGKFDAYESQQKNSVNSMGTAFISNAYSQYTKDFIKSEYSRSQKLPSIRQLQECAFKSTES